MRKHYLPVLAAALAAGALTATASAALAAFPHGVAQGGGGGGGSAPLVSPGPTQPSIGTVAGFSVSGGGIVLTGGSANNITPAFHGNPADTGYNVRGTIRPDQMQWREFGKPGADTTFHIGFSVYHDPTDAEKALGIPSNIDHVDIRCDENTGWTSITSQTVNPDASGRTDWNAYSHTSLWADGLHKCDMRGVPTTGPDVIAQGPGIDQYGNNYEDIKVPNAVVSDGHGGAGNILTLPTGSVYNFTSAGLSANVFSIGHSVALMGVGPDTFIDGDATHNNTACAAQWGSNCNGVGSSNANYHVTQASIGGIAFNGTASGYGVTLNSYVGVTLPQVGSYIVRADLPANLQVISPNFTASASGTTLTVTVPPTTGGLMYGMTIGDFPGSTNILPANTTIVADAAHSPTMCSPNCTGTPTGGGTYALSTSVGTIASTNGFYAILPSGAGGVLPVNQSVTSSAEAMVASMPAEFGIAKSFYFFTNYNGTAYRPQLYVSPSGVDNSGCGAIGSPCLTLGRALQNAWNNDPSPITSHNAVNGAVLCFEDPTGTSTYGYTGAGTTHEPDSSLGWTEFVNGSNARCNVASDHGNATLAGTTINSDNGSYPQRTLWHDIHSSGPNTLATGNMGLSWHLAADHLVRTQTSVSGAGLLYSSAAVSGGGALITGADACVDSVAWWGQDGICDPAMLVRGNTAKYFVIDSLHNDEFSINNGFDYGGVIFYWTQATTTSGSNVITNVSVLPAELAGISLAAIYNPNAVPVAGQPAVQVIQAGSLTECFPTGVLMFAGATTSNTITVVDASGNPVNATSSCVNGNLSWPLAASLVPHPDNIQLSIDNIAAMDLVIDGNNFALTTPGFQQGQFFERTFMSGGWIGNNQWKNHPLATPRIFLSNGGNENLIQFNNTYSGGFGGFAVDNNGASSGMTYIKDQSLTGNQMLPPVHAGTGLRTLAAPSNAAYTTSTP